MYTHLFVLIFILIHPPTARALIGPQLSDKNIPENFCRYIIRDKATQAFVTACGGTLISDSEIATAAHCLSDVDETKVDITAECGYIGSSDFSKLAPEKAASGNLFQVKGVHFKESHHVNHFRLDPNHSDALKANGDDLAILELGTKSKLQTVAIFNSQTDIQDRYPQVKCFLVGSGMNKDKLGGLPLRGEAPIFISDEQSASSYKCPVLYPSGSILIGRTYSDIKGDGPLLQLDSILGPKLNSVDAQLAQDPHSLITLLIFLNNKDLIPTPSLMPGDSGGPLFCSFGEGRPYRLVAVATSGGAKITSKTSEVTELANEMVWTVFDQSKIH